MSGSIILKISVIATTLLTLIINFLAIALPINERTTASISDSFYVYFKPAGYVFGIWALIYILLIGYTIKQISLNYPKSDKIRFLATVCNILNSLWILAWHYLRFDLSALLMIGLLLTLSITYIEMKNITFTNILSSIFLKQFFGVYLAWISVATIANITIYLDYIRWDNLNLSSLTWGIIMILISAVLASVVYLQEKDIWFGAVIIWALVGIHVNFRQIAEINFVVLLGICVIIASVLYKSILTKIFR
jgi:hypothetical protein